MLDKITIDNFKSLKHLTYECAGLNLLMGVNGSGKSSFVRFLLSLRALSRMDIQPYGRYALKDLDLDGKWSDYCYSYAKDGETMSFAVEYKAKESFCWSEGEHCTGTICRDIGVDEEDSASVFVERREMRKLWMDIVNSKDADSVRKEEHNLLYKKLVDNEAPILSAFKNTWDGMKYVDAFRVQPKSWHVGTGRFGTKDCATGLERSFDPEGNDAIEYLYKFGRVHKLDEDNPMIFPGSTVEHVLHMNEEIFSQMTSSDYFGIDPLSYCDEHKSRHYAVLIDQVTAWLGVVSPGAQFRIARHEFGNQEEYAPTVEFGFGKAKRDFKPQNVGLGISYALPVLLALLTARPTDIVIIENPEAHLHPRGQAKMGNLIARAVASGVQVFVETHSDHVINGVRVAVKKGIVKPEDVNIAFFERKPHDVPQEDGTTKREIYSEVTNIKVDANGALSEWPKDFVDEWGIQQMKLLRP